MSDQKQIQLIGLTGKMGSGKDEAFKRMQFLFGEHAYRRQSFAQPLKQAVAALFNVNVDVLEAWKNEPSMRVSVLDLKGNGRDLGRSFSVREVMQRFGTEVGREIFGEDFWVETAMRSLEVPPGRFDDVSPATNVFTDVRFENEAQAIKDRGGVIVLVSGADVDTGDHPSEAGIPDHLVDFTINNSHRPDRDPELLMAAMEAGSDELVREAQGEARAHLDAEAARLHAELSA